MDPSRTRSSNSGLGRNFARAAVNATGRRTTNAAAVVAAATTQNMLEKKKPAVSLEHQFFLYHSIANNAST
jgi:hypothetical protein